MRRRPGFYSHAERIAESGTLLLLVRAGTIMSGPLSRSLETALRETPWRESFVLVAEWLESVDDYDYAVLFDGAKELRRRADAK